MFNYDNYRVILSCGATDMRKNIIMAPGIKQKIKRSEVFKKC